MLGGIVRRGSLTISKNIFFKRENLASVVNFLESPARLAELIPTNESPYKP